MNKRQRWIFVSITLAVLLVLVAFTSPIRGVIPKGESGGFISIPSMTFIDPASGREFNLTLIGREYDAGTGQVTLQLLGPGFSACSTHGGGVDIGTSEDGENFGGNMPLNEIQCGTAYGMAVAIDGCDAKTEMHGYIHSDYPFSTYTGSVTIEANIHKTASGGQVNLKVYTPRGPVKLQGSLNGDFTLDTCR